MNPDPHNPFAPPNELSVPVINTADGIPYEQLRTTAAGLGAMYTGLSVCVAGIIFAVFVMAASSPLASVVSWGPMLLGFAAGAGFLVGILFTIVGQVMCVSVPREVGGRVLVLIALGLTAFVVPAAVVMWRFPFGGGTTSGFLTLIILGPFMISAMFFALFLRRLSRFIRQDILVRRSTHLMIACVLTMASAPLAILVSWWLFSITVILAIAVFVMYGNLIQAVGRVIRSGGATEIPSDHLG